MERYYYIAYETPNNKGALWYTYDGPINIFKILDFVAKANDTTWEKVVIFHIHELTSQDVDEYCKRAGIKRG